MRIGGEDAQNDVGGPESAGPDGELLGGRKGEGPFGQQRSCNLRLEGKARKEPHIADLLSTSLKYSLPSEVVCSVELGQLILLLRSFLPLAQRLTVMLHRVVHQHAPHLRLLNDLQPLVLGR